MGVVFASQHAFGGGVFGGGDEVAAGDDLEVAVAAGEAVGVVKDLDIVVVALGVVDGVLVFPVVVILVEGDGADAAGGEVEGGVAEVGRSSIAAAR